MTWARQIENVELLYMLDLEDALFFLDLLYTLEVYLFLEYIKYLCLYSLKTL